MSSSSSLATAAVAGFGWSELPEGPLTDIARRMETHFDILRLRAVCKSWRSSLSLQLPGNPITVTVNPDFPLNLPSLNPHPASSSFSFSPYANFSLHRTTLYRLSPAWDDSASPWLIRVSETKLQTFSILYPLLGSKIESLPEVIPRSIDLLRFRISRITHLYIVEKVDPWPDSSPRMQNPIKKVVLGKDFFETGDFVVLVLTVYGELAVWRVGDESWSWIVADGRHFNDIVSFKGKFYATCDNMGTLVTIDSRLMPITLVKDLMYGNGWVVHLVESGSNLYLVDQVGGIMKLTFGLYKLDEKGRFWDYEFQLEDDRVLFLCEGGNFMISMKDYVRCKGNCVCFSRNEDEMFVFDVGENKMIPAQSHASLFWPPPRWLSMAVAPSTK